MFEWGLEKVDKLCSVLTVRFGQECMWVLNSGDRYAHTDSVL